MPLIDDLEDMLPGGRETKPLRTETARKLAQARSRGALRSPGRHKAPDLPQERARPQEGEAGGGSKGSGKTGL